MDVTDFELKVLRTMAGDEIPGMVWGAAMSEAVEALRGGGYCVLRGTQYELTLKGYKVILADRGTTLDKAEARLAELEAAVEQTYQALQPFIEHSGNMVASIALNEIAKKLREPIVRVALQKQELGKEG